MAVVLPMLNSSMSSVRAELMMEVPMELGVVVRVADGDGNRTTYARIAAEDNMVIKRNFFFAGQFKGF